MRSPASGRSPPRSSSPRSGWTCPASRPPGTCVRGRSSRPGSTLRRERSRATARTGHGNRYLARILGEAAVAAGEPTPSSANATAASPDGEARNARSSPSAVPSWSSSGTCWPAGHKIHRPRAGSLHQTHQPGGQETQPHPPTRSARLQRHPHPSRLNPSDPRVRQLRSSTRTHRQPTHHHFRIS